MTRFNVVFLASAWLAAGIVPTMAAGISCCALGMGAGSMFEVCSYWSSPNLGCNNLAGCVREITPSHKYAAQWCDYCLQDAANTACASDALAPFPNYKPPGAKRSIVGDSPTVDTTSALEKIEPSEELLALVQPDIATNEKRDIDQFNLEQSLDRRALNHAFTIPARGPGSSVSDFIIGALKVTIVTSARGIIQFGIQNLSQAAISWSFQDNTALDVQTGTTPAAKTEYFRYNDGAPGDHCVFYTN